LSIFRTGYLDLGDGLQLNLVFSEQGSGKGDRVGGIDGEIINNTDLIKVIVHLVDKRDKKTPGGVILEEMGDGVNVGVSRRFNLFWILFEQGYKLGPPGGLADPIRNVRNSKKTPGVQEIQPVLDSSGPELQAGTTWKLY